MTTRVGTQEGLGSLVNALIELDYNAVAAYEAAAERVELPLFAAKVREFCEDHQKHILLLKPHAGKHSDCVASGPDLKELVTKGWVVAANWLGDRAILMALLSLEGDTQLALERSLKHPELDLGLKRTLHRLSEDEARHKRWLEQAVHPELFADSLPSLAKNHVSTDDLKETNQENLR